jgi:hypothetical protein
VSFPRLGLKSGFPKSLPNLITATKIERSLKGSSNLNRGKFKRLSSVDNNNYRKELRENLFRLLPERIPLLRASSAACPSWEVYIDPPAQRFQFL